ncbi:MAG TPA: hypothetical protein VKD72_07915, partial [Gemmataceae bacterium]|nr:hypothetical protein [Gemmataceae bacterium]
MELEQLESRDLPSFALHLDFGTLTSPVAAGYTPMPLTSYAPVPGYGWASTSGLIAYNVNTTDPLTCDGHQGTNAGFKVDL